MAFKFNPFRPNSIVGSSMFAGRGNEIGKLDQGLFQTKSGNPWHFLIHGERGIGKSSLLYCTEQTAKGVYSSIENTKFNFVTVSIELDGDVTFEGLSQKIGYEFQKNIRSREAVKSAGKDVWGFLKRWEVAGIKYNTEDKQNENHIEDLCDTLQKSIGNLKNDGVLILIDEADRVSPRARLGEYLKRFTERLVKIGCGQVAIGISGISPTVIKKLKDSHESAPRILNAMLLEPLEDNEVRGVINKGLDESNEISKQNTSITNEALSWIIGASEGYPHFVQQYAYSAFEATTNDEIELEDVKAGSIQEHGALDQLGACYFEGMYMDQINSDDYRKVLHALADSGEEYMARKTIKTISSLKESTLTNALRALKAKGIIISHRERPGLYKLPSRSFAVWIRMKRWKDEEAKKKIKDTRDMFDE